MCSYLNEIAMSILSCNKVAGEVAKLFAYVPDVFKALVFQYGSGEVLCPAACRASNGLGEPCPTIPNLMYPTMSCSAVAPFAKIPTYDPFDLTAGLAFPYP